MQKINTFDICLHKPSNKYYFVRYVIPDYDLENYKGGYRNLLNHEETNWWLWSLMPSKIGGVYSGSVIEHVAERLSFKWFLSLYKLCLN